MKKFLSLFAVAVISQQAIESWTPYTLDYRSGYGVRYNRDTQKFELLTLPEMDKFRCIPTVQLPPMPPMPSTEEDAAL